MIAKRFSHFLAIDWSGAKGRRQKGIALALADGAGGPPVLVEHGRGWGREDVLALLRDDLPPDTLVGMDLGIALPFADCGAYFPGLADSPPDAPALWARIDAVCADDSHLEAGSFVSHPAFAAFFLFAIAHLLVAGALTDVVFFWWLCGLLVVWCAPARPT